MTTPPASPGSIDHWISETNAIHAKLGDPSRLRRAVAGEIVSGRFGGLHETGTSTFAVVDRDAEDDSIALPVTETDLDRLRGSEVDAEIHLLAR